MCSSSNESLRLSDPDHRVAPRRSGGLGGLLEGEESSHDSPTRTAVTRSKTIVEIAVTIRTAASPRVARSSAATLETFTIWIAVAIKHPGQGRQGISATHLRQRGRRPTAPAHGSARQVATRHRRGH